MTAAVPFDIGGFDVCGELPSGTTVLEASAGTGKTFTIAALAARYLAEGHADLPELLLVTFGRVATQELRERVRGHLVQTERALGDPAGARASANPVSALLAQGDDAEVSRRRRRLTRALAHFDAATIATTHQFCRRMLAGLGVAGDVDSGSRFVDDLDDLVAEVVDDFYVRKYAAGGSGRPDFTRREALRLALAAVRDGQARLEPQDAPDGTPAQVRRRFAESVRQEVERRKRDRRLFGYDDMLTRLAAALRDPVRGPAACARLRERFRVVLVDEFQDTDPTQWEILRRAFHERPDAGDRAALVLVGDPKQAIYAFRGADVVSYLAAAGQAGTHGTLATNWRSDAPLLAALGTVFSGAALGDRRIVVRPVAAAHTGPRLTGTPSPAAVRLRVLSRAGLPVNRVGVAVGVARALVATDLAEDVGALLAAGARLPAVAPTAAPDGRPVHPGDVAVLVRTNAQGVLVRDALAAAGIPAVLAGTESVFSTVAASEWLRLLEALEQPHRGGLVRSAALTCFAGRSVAELAGYGDEQLGELTLMLRRWSDVLAARGVAALLEAVTASTALPARLLGTVGGERRLTDVRHIAEALHVAALEGQLGVGALVGWLRRRIRESGEETVPERSRRLESDSDAVQVTTVHRSKGLQFPVVYVPFGWDRFVERSPSLLLLHDDAGARVLDVGGPGGPGRADRLRRHRAEDAGEDLRVLYVALTRAQCRLVAWWVPSVNTGASALHRLLFGRPAAGEEPRPEYPVPEDAAAWEAFAALGAGVAVERVGTPGTPRWSPPAPAPAGLTAARLDRRLDSAWRRTSYTALTAAAHARAGEPSGGVGSEPESDIHDDEPTPRRSRTSRSIKELVIDQGVDAASRSTPADPGGERDDRTGPGALRAGEVPPAPADLPSPMAALPAGTAFGVLVHGVLEATDTTAPDLLAELAARAEVLLAGRPPGTPSAATLAAALLPVLHTPLGPLAGGRCLRDFAPADRLTEVAFELPLAGGERPHAEVTLAQLAPLLRRHLDADDPLAGYADVLDAPPVAAQHLRGFLTGSVDAVLRLTGAPGPSFLVVDYKTNWLGPVGPDGAEPLTARHYTPHAMARAMLDAHYPLQALLYSVALHRFLRWRLPGYQPARHLGGILYLFVRGMCGPGTPTVGGVPCGVVGWRPPPALVTDLSGLLDEGSSSTKGAEPCRTT